MRKSNKCSYKIGENVKSKRKFLRPEEAVEFAKKLNEQPNTIKKHVAYKCTTCQFFHIGRTYKDIKREGPTVFTPRTEITIPEVAIFGTPEIIGEAITEPEDIITDDHDEFDWDTDKKILK